MFQQVQRRSKILSTGAYLPKQRVKLDDLLTEIRSEQQYNTPTRLDV